MSRTRRIAWLLLLACPLSLLAEDFDDRLKRTSPWELTVRNRVIEVNRADGRLDGFNQFIFVPTHILNLLASLPEPERKTRVWNLLHERETAGATLRIAGDMIWNVYQDRKTIRPENEAFMLDEMHQLAAGRYPGVMTSTYGDSFDLHELLFVAPAGPHGTPTETFLKRIDPKVPSPERPFRYAPTPVTYIPPTGKREVNEEISRVLSKIPRITGEAVELVKRVRNPDSPYDFTLEQISDLIAYDLLFWSQTPIEAVPQSVRDQVKPLSEPLLSEVLELKKKYPSLPDELLFPEKQTRVVIDRVVFATGSEKLLRHFQERWGIFPDPRAYQYGATPSDRVFLGEMAREAFTRKVLSTLRQSPAALVVEEGTLRPSAIGATSCYTLNRKLTPRYANQFEGLRVGPHRSYRHAPGSGIIYRLFKSLYGSPANVRRAWEKAHR